MKAAIGNILYVIIDIMEIICRLVYAAFWVALAIGMVYCLIEYSCWIVRYQLTPEYATVSINNTEYMLDREEQDTVAEYIEYILENKT